MHVPQSIQELLDERIQFCETVLLLKDNISASRLKEEMIAAFEISLVNLLELDRMLTLILHGDDQLKHRFKPPAKQLVRDMKQCALEQMKGNDRLVTLHNALDLIDGLDKIILAIDAL